MNKLLELRDVLEKINNNLKQLHKTKQEKHIEKDREMCEIAKNGQWSIKKTNDSMLETSSSDINSI